MKKRLFYLAGLAMMSTYAQEIKQDSLHYERLDEVFISDSKFKLKGPQSGRHIIKISRREIENQQAGSIAALINTKSGIEINGSRSNSGQNLAYYIRGGNNRQVLILIDGVQVSDPSQIASDFDLRLLDINQIEHIEIIKGATSTLYGNSAAAGVINITTRKNSKKAFSGYFSTRIGTNRSQNQGQFNLDEFNHSLSINGSGKKFNYTLSLGQYHVNGLSAVSSGSEKDPFTRENASLRIGFQENSNFHIDAFIALDHYSASFDNAFPLEDALFKSAGKQKRIGINPTYNYRNGSLNLNASFLEVARNVNSNFPNDYKAKKQLLDFYNKYNFGSNVRAILGLNYIKNEAFFERYRADVNFDPYVNVILNSNVGLNLNLGGRLNNHSQYGNQFIYNINPSYVYQWSKGYFKVFGSLSTSFIAPSLPQLFGPYGANRDLKPETNRTVELGWAYKNQGIRLTALYFDRTEKDFIDFVIVNPVTFESQYQNVQEKFDVKGIELDFSVYFSKELRLSANYTFTDKKEKNLRIPKHKANLSLDYLLADRTNLALRYQFTDKRLDTDFTTFENRLLSEFSTIDLMFAHQLIKNRIKLSGGITNLLNTEFNELIGYSTKGRNFNLGVTLAL